MVCMAKPHNLMFAPFAAMAVALSVALLVSSLAIPVAAKIECKNPAKKKPRGAQGKDKCNGLALTNENPAYKATRGWNNNRHHLINLRLHLFWNVSEILLFFVHDLTCFYRIL